MDNIFKQNPSLPAYHKTADGQCFYQELDARNHAKTLDNKAVETITNPGTLNVTAEDVAPSVKSTASAGKAADAKDYPMNAVNTAKAVKDCKALAELDQFKDDERATVVTAVAKRRAELEAAAPAATGDADADNTGNGADADADKSQNANQAEGADPDNGDNKTE